MRIRKEIRQEARLVKWKMRMRDGLFSLLFPSSDTARAHRGGDWGPLRVKPDSDLRLAELREQAVMPSATVRASRGRCWNVS